MEAKLENRINEPNKIKEETKKGFDINSITKENYLIQDIYSTTSYKRLEEKLKEDSTYISYGKDKMFVALVADEEKPMSFISKEKTFRLLKGKLYAPLLNLLELARMKNEDENVKRKARLIENIDITMNMIKKEKSIDAIQSIEVQNIEENENLFVITSESYKDYKKKNKGILRIFESKILKPVEALNIKLGHSKEHYLDLIFLNPILECLNNPSKSDGKRKALDYLELLYNLENPQEKIKVETPEIKKNGNGIEHLVETDYDLSNLPVEFYKPSPNDMTMISKKPNPKKIEIDLASKTDEQRGTEYTQRKEEEYKKFVLDVANSVYENIEMNKKIKIKKTPIHELINNIFRFEFAGRFSEKVIKLDSTQKLGGLIATMKKHNLDSKRIKYLEGILKEIIPKKLNN